MKAVLDENVTRRI